MGYEQAETLPSRVSSPAIVPSAYHCEEGIAIDTIKYSVDFVTADSEWPAIAQRSLLDEISQAFRGPEHVVPNVPWLQRRAKSSGYSMRHV
jgi:hypothetical protein